MSTQMPQAFDTSSTAPSTGRDFPLLPKGTRLRAVVSESEVKETNSKNGWYIALKHTVTEDGPHKNRNFWTNINIKNPNEKAEQIGKADLAALCLAVGFHGNLADTASLHNIEHFITLGVEAAQGKYEARNNISKYESISSAAPAVSPHAPATSSAPASAPAAAAVAPWLAGKK